MYSIYLIRNLKNGKGYVGITKQAVETRFRQHCRPSSNCSILGKAIQKHGSSSFVFGTIVTCESKEKAEELEREYIIKLNTIHSGEGYNLASGGDYVGSHSELTRRKMSKSHTGVKRPPMTEEQKVKISETRIERGLKTCPELLKRLHEERRGHKFPKEFGEQISERQRGSDNPSATSVKASTGEIFGSIVEAATWCNGNKGGIANCARGLSKSSGRHPITKEKLSWTQYKEVNK